MRNTLLLAAMFISGSAFAAKISFTYFGNEGGRQSLTLKQIENLPDARFIDL